MFNDVCDVFKLSELVTIMVREHAFWTNDCMAELAEILDLLVLMLKAVDFAAASLSYAYLRHLALHTGSRVTTIDALIFLESIGVLHLWHSSQLGEYFHDLLIYW